MNVKPKLLKKAELPAYVSPDHVATWDIIDEKGKKVGQIRKYAYLQPVCRGTSLHVTHYRRETSWNLSWRSEDGITLRPKMIQYNLRSLKSAVEQWGFFAKQAAV